MNKLLRTMTAASVAVSLLSPVAFAQGKQQTVARIDVTKVASGWRSSKIVGSSIINERNETIGKIDDLIIGRDDRALVAVLSVGGFVGVGGKLVAVPYDQLRASADNRGFMLAGASKDSLKAMPDFKYAN